MITFICPAKDRTHKLEYNSNIDFPVCVECDKPLIIGNYGYEDLPEETKRYIEEAMEQ